ncbi:MAG: hypothetical protein ACJAWV_002248 [Flammeovirgaceae bacterium]|jgi:hypothetical protein
MVRETRTKENISFLRVPRKSFFYRKALVIDIQILNLGIIPTLILLAGFEENQKYIV